MVPAQKNMIDLISKVSLGKPTVPVISNISANPTQNPEEIRENLIKQITGRARWRESILYMHKFGVRKTYEIGPGRVLCNLIKRTVNEIEQTNISTIEDLDKCKDLVNV